MLPCGVLGTGGLLAVEAVGTSGSGAVGALGLVPCAAGGASLALLLLHRPPHGVGRRRRTVLRGVCAASLLWSYAIVVWASVPVGAGPGHEGVLVALLAGALLAPSLAIAELVLCDRGARRGAPVAAAICLLLLAVLVVGSLAALAALILPGWGDIVMAGLVVQAAALLVVPALLAVARRRAWASEDRKRTLRAAQWLMGTSLLVPVPIAIGFVLTFIGMPGVFIASVLAFVVLLLAGMALLGLELIRAARGAADGGAAAVPPGSGRRR